MEFITFSFVQGVMAFLAPCAIALLPGYIVAYISRGSDHSSRKTKLLRGMKLAFFSIAGILLIYALAGGLIVVAAQFLKQYMKYITVGMAAILLILGFLMIFGKSFSININFNEPSTKRESSEAFFFGIAYAIGALGCLFPLFLVVATQAMAAPSTLLGGAYILAYFFGLSLMMVVVILLATFARELLMKYLRKIMPHMEKISGVILILAAIYIIQYQMILF
jgi:cytochrome c biogenesis protein CcdA